MQIETVTLRRPVRRRASLEGCSCIIYIPYVQVARTLARIAVSLPQLQTFTQGRADCKALMKANNLLTSIAQPQRELFQGF